MCLSQLHFRHPLMDTLLIPFSATLSDFLLFSKGSLNMLSLKAFNHSYRICKIDLHCNGFWPMISEFSSCVCSVARELMHYTSLLVANQITKTFTIDAIRHGSLCLVIFSRYLIGTSNGSSCQWTWCEASTSLACIQTNSTDFEDFSFFTLLWRKQ